MKRICFINGSMGRGGAERVISIVTKNTVEFDYQSDICLLLESKVDYDLDETTRIFNCCLEKSSSIIKKSIYWMRKLRKYIRTEKPEIVIAMSTKEYLLVKFASVGIKVRIIVSERNDPNCDGRGKLTDMLTTIFYPKASKIIFQTRRAQSYFNKKIQDNSVIIPNPVHVSCKATYPDSKKIVNVGRLEPQKNQKLLLHAFAEVYKEYPQYKLIIYGNGSLLDELKTLASELGIADNVCFAGEVSNVQEMISDAEMFVLSSDYEGLSNALLEALSIGVPCISTNCAGAEECVDSGKSGIIVPVGNCSAMVNAITTFIMNKEYRINCGMNGKIGAEKFQVNNVISSWKDIFDAVIEES